jgi:hypothetical protein
LRENEGGARRVGFECQAGPTDLPAFFGPAVPEKWRPPDDRLEDVAKKIYRRCVCLAQELGHLLLGRSGLDFSRFPEHLG